MTVLERESRLHGLRILRQPQWRQDFPDLEQGITGRGAARFGLPADRTGGEGEAGAPDAWARLMEITGIDRLVRCEQVHGSEVRVCERDGTNGVEVLGEADALVTGREGVLLAITVADCVPVFLIDPRRRALGLAHAGWRGTAAGIVGETLARLADLGSKPQVFYAHLGPAICGACYEVGPEVCEALGLGAAGARHVDLRRRILEELRAAGLRGERVTVSDACTRCQNDTYYSYRGGDRHHRMCAFLGWSTR